MPLPDNAAPILARALEKRLGTASPGSMAFIRCLPSEVARGLAADARFSPAGWRVALVCETCDDDRRAITADVAVEWRESKSEAVLLLVDAIQAGAGMDGIYSAAREVGEAELFDCALQMARDRIAHGGKGFATSALRTARRLARTRTLSPWREFAYLCRSTRGLAELGAALPEVGLWPVAVDEQPHDEDLNRSATLVERLLVSRPGRKSAEARVDGLQLPADEADLRRELADFLRSADGLPRLEALARLADHQRLWLKRLRPGVFDAQALHSIRWVGWRQRNGRPYAWSGLQDIDGRLTLTLPLQDNPGQRARLEVRWQAEPAGLARGAVEYRVEVRAGDDPLAEKLVSHTALGPQKCVFTRDDFGDFEENDRFEAEVIIRALTGIVDDGQEADAHRAVSEDLVVRVGEVAQTTRSTAGSIYPTLALAAIQVTNDVETFDRLAENPGNRQAFSSDRKGYIACRANGKAARVLCPKLLLDLAVSWVEHQGNPGSWQLKVRADGTPDGVPTFMHFGPIGGPKGERFVRASRAFCTWLGRSSLGPLAVLYTDRPVFNEYVLAATAWWEDQNTPARATLIHTLEVIGVSGERIGLVVLPTHPLRVAWQQGFDLLARRHRYEEGAAPTKVARLLGSLIGAHYPAMLPGFDRGEAFVFADSLGFHTVAMTATDDPEPKATVALIARLLASGDASNEELLAPSVGRSAAELLGEEIARYLDLHPETRRVRVHALRPGDAMPAARALGRALRMVERDEAGSNGDAAGEAADPNARRAFVLDLYPAKGGRSGVGRFLAATAARRRSGAGAIAEGDRWLLDSVTRPGGVSLPRLAWAKRDSGLPVDPAHLALAFDIFETKIECRPRESVPEAALEVHGLALTPERCFKATPMPRWESFIAAAARGETHPVNRAFSDRLGNAHSALLRCVARQLGAGENDWPTLVTEVSADATDMLATLHRLCDWVVTVDRHAGIEYFDSPRELPKLYDAYLIDCVPERDDLGFLQLITSTSSLEEIVRLLDAALGEMGLSASPRNCRFLLDALKAVSGRLALRLSRSGSVAQELVALALVHSHCASPGGADSPWLPLAEGFFVPLDDVPELFGALGDRRDAAGQRADLLYVTAGHPGGLSFCFVEVKFRRYLKTARTIEFVEAIGKQLDASCSRWERLFGQATTPLEKTVQRARLARVLRFYARKGHRHTLRDEAFRRIDGQLARFASSVTAYELPVLDEKERARVGFVFCPEYGAVQPVEIGSGIWLFGPSHMPDSRGRALPGSGDNGLADLQTPEAPTPPPERAAGSVATGLTASDVAPRWPASDGDTAAAQTGDTVGLLLGQRIGSEDAVYWRLGIRGNPHLLIVGLPGMGKTTCLIELCRQLIDAGIAPIVFSYHEDIDERLTAICDGTLRRISYAGLGFNPLQVVGDSPLAYMDNVTLLRDNFAAIFPDLGDVQLGQIRSAIKQTYAACGWSTVMRSEIPPFGAFYELLRDDPKTDRRLMTRLAELADYDLFQATSDSASLLDDASPALVRIHATQNEVLQRAFSTLILHHLYQSMFRRGTQARITHAVVFDEAHRAARLKLLPTMAKECRKYGLSFVVASQEAQDFDSSLFTAIANYLALRVSEPDARLMARIFAPSDKVRLYGDRIKQADKFTAWFYSEGMRLPVHVALHSGQTGGSGR